MKRHKQKYPQIRKIEPLIFWRECRFCGREFKGELGYEILDYTKVNPYLYYSYCCNECGWGIEDVRLKVITINLQSPPM